LNVKLQGEKHTTLDLITTARPFQKKFHVFKHVIQTELVIFRGIWENKSKKIPDMFKLLISLLTTLPQLGVFSFRK